mmetsp:Transcript_7116/g.14012  ORF Transcript_7116/g.14012 Transcript_7116/m.14012 type:complete len:602 (+) Transcript_7116:510-2315(+)
MDPLCVPTRARSVDETHRIASQATHYRCLQEAVCRSAVPRRHHALELYPAGSTGTVVVVVPSTAPPVIDAARYGGTKSSGKGGRVDPSSTGPPGVLVYGRVQNLEGGTKGRGAHQERRRHEASLVVVLAIAAAAIAAIVVVVVGPRRIDAVVGDTLAALGQLGAVSTAGSGLFEIRALAVFLGGWSEVPTDVVAGHPEALVLVLQRFSNDPVVGCSAAAAAAAAASASAAQSELVVDRFGGRGRTRVQVRQQCRRIGGPGSACRFRHVVVVAVVVVVVFVAAVVVAAAVFFPRQHKGRPQHPLDPRNPHQAHNVPVGVQGGAPAISVPQGIATGPELVQDLSVDDRPVSVAWACTVVAFQDTELVGQGPDRVEIERSVVVVIVIVIVVVIVVAIVVPRWGPDQGRTGVGGNGRVPAPGDRGFHGFAGGLAETGEIVLVLGAGVDSEFQHQAVDPGKDVHGDGRGGNGGVAGGGGQAGKILVSVPEGSGGGGSSAGSSGGGGGAAAAAAAGAGVHGARSVQRGMDPVVAVIQNAVVVVKALVFRVVFLAAIVIVIVIVTVGGSVQFAIEHALALLHRVSPKGGGKSVVGVGIVRVVDGAVSL